MSRYHQKTGASKSLNKTITELMAHLGDDGDRPKNDLRGILREKVGDLAESWFGKGFNRGHKEAHKQFEEQGVVPVMLKAKAKRTLASKQRRKVKLRSTIKTKSADTGKP
jgi:TPR repeat protein